jgi:hypothetical protein
MNEKTTRQMVFDLLDADPEQDKASLAANFPELKRTTTDRYYYAWKKQQQAPEAEPQPEVVVQEAAPTVSVIAIQLGGKFNYNGELFRRVPAGGGAIVAQRLVQHQFSNTFIPRGTIKLDPGTQVTPS